MTTDTHPIAAHWRIVHEEEANLVHAVHLDALNGVDAGLVRPDTLAHFIQHIGSDGVVIGGFLDRIGMIAYGVLGISSETAHHMAHILGVAIADRSRFCILDGAASLPAWRGHGLHRDLIRERVKCARTLDRTLFGATVSPANITSLRGLLEAKFQIAAFAMLYGGMDRLVLIRDLHADNRRWVLRHKVPVTDVLAHQAALAEGLTGFACEETGKDIWHVHYGESTD